MYTLKKIVIVITAVYFQCQFLFFKNTARNLIEKETNAELLDSYFENRKIQKTSSGNGCLRANTAY